MLNPENICIILFTILLIIFVFMIYKDDKEVKNSVKDNKNKSPMSAMMSNMSDMSDMSDKNEYDPCEGKVKDPQMCKKIITQDINDLNNLCKQDLSNPVVKSAVCSVACDNSKYFKNSYDKSSCLNVCGKCEQNKKGYEPICDSTKCTYTPCSDEKCKNCPGAGNCAYNMKDYSPQFK